MKASSKKAGSYRFRSAKTGKFVRSSFAKRYPKSTIRERVTA